ncbi:MAG: CRTAC1 family protein [Acidobacteriota bacterium]
MQQSAAAVASPTSLFVDRADAVGLEFEHRGGRSGELYFLEIMGPGGALLDVDNDGDLDVFLPQGHALPAAGTATTPVPGDRLFRNDLEIAADGSRQLAFTDVTDTSGIAKGGYGVGVAAADFDNDGWVDLYVTNFGSNRLWRNRGGVGDGGPMFQDVTETAGADDPGWSTSAAFVDFDLDGWLDLYIVSYVDYTLQGDVGCRSPTGLPDYCSPLTYPPRGDRLLRNLGPGADGVVRFDDVTRSAGIAAASERGLGVVTGDFNGDSWPDLYVANDMTPNFLWINRGTPGDNSRWAFANEALLAGAAVNRRAKPEASMGVSVGDVDGDGDEDLFMTHLANETHTLFLSDGRGLFSDATDRVGLAGASLEATGFGTALFDFDNDGALDILAVNGAVTIIEAQVRAGEDLPLRQPNQLFRNLGVRSGSDLAFEEVTERAGAVFALPEVSRGAAVGDIDNDGDLDVLVTNNHGPVRLLDNAVGNRNHWLGLRLVEQVGGRDAFGAVARVVTGDGQQLERRVRTDGSYCSASDPRLLVGLGTAASIEHLEVIWPGGVREVFEPPVRVDQYLTLVRGGGRGAGVVGEAER